MIILTEEGRKYARYIYLTNRILNHIPFIGKYAQGFLAAFVFTFILKEGEKENVRHRKTQVSRVQHRTGADRSETTQEMREVRVPDSRLRTVPPLVQTSTKGCHDQEIIENR